MVEALIALAGLTSFFCLAVLGAMREVVLLRGEVKAFRDIVQRPPPPSFVHERIPAALIAELEGALAADRVSDRLVVSFVAPGCGPCEALVDGLAAAVANGKVDRDDLGFVIWTMEADAGRLLQSRVPSPAIVDAGGALSRACEIRGTPTVFLVSRVDYSVLDYTLEGTAEWVISRLTNVAAPRLSTIS